MFLYRQPFEPKERTPCERSAENVPRYSKGTKQIFDRDVRGLPSKIIRVEEGYLLDIETPFIRKLIEYSSRLQMVLGARAVRHGPQAPYIRELIDKAHHYHLKREYIYRDYDLVKLRFIAEDCERVKNYDSKLFKKLKKAILKSKDRCHYYGYRYELFLVSLLIAKGIKFSKPSGQRSDRGDLIIDSDRNQIVLEATATCIDKKLPGSDNFQYKLEQAIRHKGTKKKYAHPQNVLFIDASNANFHATPKEPGMHMFNYAAFVAQNENQTWIPDAAAQAGFGSIILTQYIVRDDEPFFEPEYDFLYTRFDSKEIAPELKAFLDLHFALTSLWNPKRTATEIEQAKQKISEQKPIVSASLFEDKSHYSTASEG